MGHQVAMQRQQKLQPDLGGEIGPREMEAVRKAKGRDKIRKIF